MSKFITEQNRKTFISIILLNEMINNNRQFRTVSNGDDSLLDPLFIELMSKGYVSTSGMNYQVTAEGRKSFDVFMKRYLEYLKVYDVFAFVDTGAGEFAFAKYYDFATDEEWNAFKVDSRFEDMRVAVAQFKKLDPAEMVFMSFINEDRFDTKTTGWQMDLLSGMVWDHIEKICETAVKPEDLGTDAMTDMVTQGSKIMVSLIQEERRRDEERRVQEQQNAQYAQGGEGDVIEETVTETTYDEEPIGYYQSYYDPYYISPIWLVPLFLW